MLESEYRTLGDTIKPDSLFLVLPPSVIESNGRFYLEDQTYNGLRLWLENFNYVAVCYHYKKMDAPADNMIALDTLARFDWLTLVPLPNASGPFSFIRHLPSVVLKLREEIKKSHYLSFALWGLWGDWGAVATLLAAAQGRKVAVWTDSVASQVVAVQGDRALGRRRLYLKFISNVMGRYERYVIRKSAMGLFHGMDTFQTYAPFSRQAHLVHDIHLGAEFRISNDELAAKRARLSTETLKIVYAGRANHDKGILDWIEVCALMQNAKLDFQAIWFGDGPALNEAHRLISKRGLGNVVTFPGPLTDRDALMAVIRDADIFMFCHKIPESPRCLVEALLSGTPIVGYYNLFAEDLIMEHHGGKLTEGTPEMLAAAIHSLAIARKSLAQLQDNAAKDGYPFVDTATFEHRSKLIKAM